MKGRSITPTLFSSNDKIKKYTLRNRSLTSNEKDFEKIFEDMKKEIFDEIKKVTEIKFKEHKEKFITFIKDYKLKENIQCPMIDDDKKQSISKRNIKRGRADISTSPNSEIEEKKEEQKIQCVNNKIKKVKISIPKENNKKNGKKNLMAFEDSKREAESKKDISNIINSTVPKVAKRSKKKNAEKKSNENLLIGKKRKRNYENFVNLFNSEPNYDFSEEEKDEKKPKRGRKRGRKRSHLKRKMK